MNHSLALDSNQPAWPAGPPADWLTFHLAHPGPGDALPGDPNCAFDYRGRYHLHYIYRQPIGYAFAHVSSDDMVHWQWRRTSLSPATTDHGMYSGTGFYTRDGRPVIIYHAQGVGRNVIQYPLDDSFDRWTPPQVVAPADDSNVPDIRYWDPDCWLMDGEYYTYSGGKSQPMMKSPDLEHWTYVGDLLHPDYPADLGVPRDEDISCGNMFHIGDRWMLLCISHRLGARYYLGDFRDEQFLPTFHAFMSFGNNDFFAPESLLTHDGRRVMWAWIKDTRLSPTGVQSLPRELSLPADGVLRIRPLRELASLREAPVSRPALTIAGDSSVALSEITGDALELEVTFAAPLPPNCGIQLFGNDPQPVVQIAAGEGCHTLQVGTSQPPFELAPGEDLTLRVFIDKNLIEVFANDRQAATWVIDAAQADPHIRLFTEDGPARVSAVQAWKIKTIYSD